MIYLLEVSNRINSLKFDHLALQNRHSAYKTLDTCINRYRSSVFTTAFANVSVFIGVFANVFVGVVVNVFVVILTITGTNCKWTAWTYSYRC